MAELPSDKKACEPSGTTGPAEALKTALSAMLDLSDDPNAKTGEFDTTAGRARRLLTALEGNPLDRNFGKDGDHCEGCITAMWCSNAEMCLAETAGPADAPLSARWQELFWALPPGEMRSKLRALEIDMGAALRGAGPADAPQEETHMSHGSTAGANSKA